MTPGNSISNNGQAMNFDSAAQIMALCETMQTAENKRALDRSLIDILMNGRRPYTDDEVKKHQIRINVNFNRGANILQDANRQLDNATIYPGKYFTATCLKGPVEKREEMGQKFTKRINRVLKKGPSGKKHRYMRKNRNASITLHGPGPVMWMTKDGWLARYIALEDLLIPTDTTLDLYNMQHLCVNLYYTQKEFYDLSHGSDKGWNTKYCEQILNALKVPGSNQTYDYINQPEAWQEQFKQNSSFYNSDKVPRVRLRLFIYQDCKNGKWYRRIVVRENPGTGLDQIAQTDKNQFVYKSDTPFADSIDEIIHIGYGDCSVVPPQKYHSIRGLGTYLYGPTEIENRLMCQSLQAAFDDLMQLLRVQNPTDRIRQLMVQLFPYAVMEDGVGFVKRDERHQPNPQLTQNALSMTRQNMSENSASFVQDINDGTNKEMTLGEAEIRANAANVMVGGLLASLYSQDEDYYREVVRRFCAKNPTDEDIKDFQKGCIEDGIPKQWVQDPEAWEISIERVVGAGDQVLAQQRSSALLSQSQRFDPTSQRIILHDWTSIMLDNPDKAAQLVPLKEPEATDGTLEAEKIFATLMQGIPVSFIEGVDQSGYTEGLIGMAAAKIGEIGEREQAGEIPNYDDLKGLDTVFQDIQRHIEYLGMNGDNKEAVKQYQDLLSQLQNEWKKFAQHFEEAQAARAEAEQINPEAQAKASSTIMLAETKARISEATAMQKMRQKEAAFQQKSRQSAESHQVSIAEQMQKFRTDMLQQFAQLQADLKSQAIETAASVATQRVQAKEKAAKAEAPAAE